MVFTCDSGGICNCCHLTFVVRSLVATRLKHKLGIGIGKGGGFPLEWARDLVHYRYVSLHTKLQDTVLSGE